MSWADKYKKPVMQEQDLMKERSSPMLLPSSAWKAAGDSGCDFAPVTAKQEQEEEGSS